MKRRDVMIGGAAAAVGATVLPAPAIHAQQAFDAGRQKDAAKKWIDSEFQPSTLSKDEQMAEMEWFINAAKPFAGMTLNTVSEILNVHEYESKTLTRAFNSGARSE